MNSRPSSIELNDTKSENAGSFSSSKQKKPVSERVEVARVEIVSPYRMTLEMENFWLQTHRDVKEFDSPYYHPEFTKAVAAVRDDVEIGVFQDSSGEIIGLLPFQRTSPNAAEPIGGRMNDFHGIIAKNESVIQMSNVMANLGLKRFGFHALTNQNDEFEHFSFIANSSFYIDLSCGFESYLNWLRQHSSSVKRLPQKKRALQRDIGEIRFDFESDEVKILDKLIELKRNKFNRTNTFDILSVEWTSNLLHEIAKRKCDGFRGLLSALWAGNNLVAVQFGMITNDVLHYWFPAYDTEFAKYSPGTQILFETCRSAAESNIKRIDMSYGESPFKSRFCNGFSQICEGVVDFNPVTFSIAKHRYFARQKLKKIPLKKNLKVLFRKAFPKYGSWHFK